MELRRILSLSRFTNYSRAFLLPLYALVLVAAWHTAVWGQASAIETVVSPHTSEHIENEGELLPVGHAVIESDHLAGEALAEDIVPRRLIFPGVLIALSEDDVAVRTAAVRTAFGGPRRWIFSLDEATFKDRAPVSSPVFGPDLAAAISSKQLIYHPPAAVTDDPPISDEVEIKTGFQWRPAINQSLMLLGIQHGYALVAQEKTRRALKGPFFRDYWRSLKGLRGWDDGNRFFTNYVAHPMQGGLTGFIYVQNSPRAMKQQFGESKEYWRDRFKAFLWSTAWSTQFELGPISQSSIGNLGMYGGMAYVDLVITPTVGTAWLIGEEALDRYLIRKWETRGFTVKMFARVLLNPMRSVANVLRFKEPWYRDRPFGY